MTAASTVAEWNNGLGPNFDKQLDAERARIEKEVEEAPIRRAKNIAEASETFRARIASQLAELEYKEDTRFLYASVTVQYARRFVPDAFINELVARGYYVTQWVHTGQFAGQDVPLDYIQIFREGAYPPGSSSRCIYVNVPCNLL